MKTMLMSTVVLVVSATTALADIIEVQMLNENEAGDRMVFSKELIRAEIGDTIRFIPTDKSHTAQSVKDAIPENQEPFRGKINQTVDYEVAEAGLTAVVCLPHQSMGMVALVVVGDDFSNAEEVLKARIPGKGGDKIEALIEEAKSSMVEEDNIENQSS